MPASKYCIDTWMKIIRFPTLERLEIQNCEGADVLFTNLSKEAYRPTRLRTLRWYDQDKCENHAVGAASGFLESLEGLQTIDIFLEDLGSQPRVDAIVKHKETLTTLSMHSYDRANGGTMHVYTDADFARICRECTGLRQLSIMFPGTNVKNMYPSNEFRSFLVSLAGMVDTAFTPHLICHKLLASFLQGCRSTSAKTFPS